MVIHWEWHPGVLFQKRHSWQSVCEEHWWNGQRRHVFWALGHVHGDFDAGWRNGKHRPGNKGMEKYWYLHRASPRGALCVRVCEWACGTARRAYARLQTHSSLVLKNKLSCWVPWNKGLQFRAGSQAHSLDVGFSKFVAASWQIVLWCSGAWRSLQAEWKLDGRAALFVCPFVGRTQPLPRPIVCPDTREAGGGHNTHTNAN